MRHLLEFTRRGLDLTQERRHVGVHLEHTCGLLTTGFDHRQVAGDQVAVFHHTLQRTELVAKRELADGLAITRRTLPAGAARLVFANLSQFGGVHRDAAHVVHLDLENGAALHGLANPGIKRGKTGQRLQPCAALLEACFFLSRWHRFALCVNCIGHRPAVLKVDGTNLGEVGREIARPQGVGEKPRQVHVALFIHGEQVPPRHGVGAGHEICLDFAQRLRFVGLYLLEEGGLAVFEVHQGGGDHAKRHQTGGSEVAGQTEIVAHGISSRVMETEVSVQGRACADRDVGLAEILGRGIKTPHTPREVFRRRTLIPW